MAKKKYLLLLRYDDTNHLSIIAFSDSVDELDCISQSNPRYGSTLHTFYVLPNVNVRYYKILDYSLTLNDIKDYCLINICQNVAEYLYYKSAAWFERAQNCASLGSDILENY